MCIRFVYRGRDLITGFNFDIDPAQWDHRILQREDCFPSVFCAPTAGAILIMGSTETGMWARCCMSTATRLGPTGQRRGA